jgi:hypothetical protein
MFTSSSQYKLIIGLEIDESNSNKKSEYFGNNEFRSFPVWNSYNDIGTFNLKEFKVVATISNDSSKVNEFECLNIFLIFWMISWLFEFFWIISQTTISND